MKTARDVFSVLIVLALLSCATTLSFEKGTCNTLATAAEAYTATMSSVADLYKKGMITAQQKETAIRYGEDFWLSYHTALDAFEEYYRTKDQSKVYAALSVLSKSLGSFLEYAQNLKQEET